MNESEIDRLAKILWQYNVMHQKLEPADAIVVFGSYNPIVGKRAAELFLAGLAPVVVFSGNRSDATSDWAKTEAETMAEVAMTAGVPRDKILLETKATNTGQNVQLTKALLEQNGCNVKKIIVVQKPYAERRAYATVKKQWPAVKVIVTSPPLSYETYMQTSPRGKSGSINTMVGDTERIKRYAEQGFQIPQEMPEEVWEACQELIKAGFTKSLG